MTIIQIILKSIIIPRIIIIRLNTISITQTKSYIVVDAGQKFWIKNLVKSLISKGWCKKINSRRYFYNI